MYFKSFLIGNVLKEFYNFQMSSRNVDTAREEEYQKLFNPFSCLYICFIIPSPSQREECSLLPWREPQKQHLEQKHFVQWLRRDICRYGSLWLKVHGSWRCRVVQEHGGSGTWWFRCMVAEGVWWLKVHGGLRCMVQFSLPCSIYCDSQR